MLIDSCTVIKSVPLISIQSFSHTTLGEAYQLKKKKKEVEEEEGILYSIF